MTQKEKYSLHLAYEPIMGTKFGNLRFDMLNLSDRYRVWALDRSKFKGSKYIVDEVNSKNLKNCSGSGFSFKQAKLYLRSFDQLTKPITQKDYNDGKPFVPAKELKRLMPNTPNFDFIFNNKSVLKRCIKIGFEHSIIEWCVVIQLLKWHFAVGFEQGEYIEVTEENKVY